MSKYTVGSLFSGIGGLDLGFERAGFTIAWQVENDTFCNKVLAKNFPLAQRYGDIRTVRSHDLSPVDALIGGFPCQDVSDAGSRTGLEGERSGLWSEFARLVRELQPKYVCVENVAALLYRGFDTVLFDLSACGYTCEWQVLPAAAFGFTHLRERVFLVAHHDSNEHFTNVFPTHFRPDQTSPANWEIIYAALSREISRARGRTYAEIRRSFYGLPDNVDRLKALGNAVVPAVAQYVAACIMTHLLAHQATMP